MLRRLPLALPALLLLFASSALAQSQRVFGTGRPLVFREAEVDRRFLRTRFARVLAQGTMEPGCVQLMGGLFTALGETAPLLHEVDDTPPLPPGLGNLLQSQLSPNNFSAWLFLQLMIRRVRLDGRLPPAWAIQAAAVNRVVQTIDMGKIRMLTDGLHPIDSAYFDIQQLRNHFEAEVSRSNSFGAATAYSEFRDAYLDHEVVFGGLTLLDLTLPEDTRDARGALGPIVTAEWMSADATPLMPSLEPMRGRTRVVVKARLNTKQYVDLARIPKGHRILLRGRFWDLNKTGTELELRDALLFEDRNWTGGALASPQAVATCSAAINDLQGIGGNQPWTGMR